MGIREIIDEIVKAKAADGGIDSVVWLAAGGSNAGNYPAQYFMDRESRKIRSQMFTSNEFVFSPAKFVGQNTLAVVTSMRGTPETILAAKTARGLGAVTIALYVQESELTEVCDYKIPYQSIMFDETDQARTNAALGMQIAMCLVDAVEGYDHYQEAMEAFDKVDPIYRMAVETTKPLAASWAELNKYEKSITVMGSGPNNAAAYIFSICNIMEMLQIESPTVNSCELFHGPFEAIDDKTSVFLLVSEGRVRPADERVVKFMKKYGGKKFYILDAKEIGVDRFDPSVAEYFNHMIFAPVLNNVYMKALSASTGEDYMTRRYMWKVEY